MKKSDIVINRLRVLINHMPLMAAKQQEHAVKRANLMLDEHFSTGGVFIKTDTSVWVSPIEKLPNDVNADVCAWCGGKSDVTDKKSGRGYCYNCIS